MREPENMFKGRHGTKRMNNGMYFWLRTVINFFFEIKVSNIKTMMGFVGLGVWRKANIPYCSSETYTKQTPFPAV